MFSCPIEYDPKREYTRREMVEIIKPHRSLLCFFAQTTGEYVLGLDFEAYSAQDSSVPVYVLDKEQTRVMVKAEGNKFKKAYRNSGLGQAIMVTYMRAEGHGWVKLRWELDEGRVMHF